MIYKLRITRRNWPKWSMFVGKFKFSLCANEYKLEWNDSVNGPENAYAWLWCMINNPKLSFGCFLCMLGNYKQELELFIGSPQHLDFVKSEHENARQELVE